MASETGGRPGNPALQGILVLDKPAGITSQQAVSRAKRALSAEKVGHGGTLDPFATGVLPLLLNSATRVAELLLADEKHYQGVARLGVVTDTFDGTGRVLAENPVPALGRDDVLGVLRSFVGEIEQVPPMFSAVKIGGQRLYKLARRQVEVERPPKRVRIDEIELLGFGSPEVEFRVRCSGGTYVRALVADVGERLGCGASLTRLRRLGSGRFRIEDAISLEELEARGADWAREPRGTSAQAAAWWREALGRSLLPVPEALPHLARVPVSEALLDALARGEPLRARHLLPGGSPFDEGAPLLLLRGERAVAVGRAVVPSGALAGATPSTMVARIERSLR